MKKCFFILLTFSFALLAKAQQHLVIEPQKPQPGAVLTIRFDPKNTTLAGVDGFEATAYLMEGKLPVAEAISLKKEGNVYTGKVKTTDNTRAVFFTFSKDEIRENNNDEGYYTALYDKKGKEVPGAQMAIGSGFGSFGGIWGLKTDRDRAKLLAAREFSSAASKEKFASDYFQTLAQSHEASDKELLKTELKKFQARKDLTEADLEMTKSLYDRLKDKENSDAVAAQLKQRFPNGNWKKMEAIAAYNKEKNFEEKLKLFNEISANYTFTKDDQFQHDRMVAAIVQKMADSGAHKEMYHYASMFKDPSMKASTFNSIAWKMAGSGVHGKPGNIDLGKELSQKSLELVHQEKKTQAAKPSYMTAKEYEKRITSTYYSYADTYATLLYHNGEFEKAYALQKEVVDHGKGKSIDNNEAFALFTEKVHGPAKTLDLLEGYLAEGKYTPKMKEQFQRLYLAQGKTEAQWAQYASELETVAFNKLKGELAKKMISQPAPDFKLKDLNGKEVALSSLKGKTVVVDFWATWCGPCIASFPGMQKAVNRFKNNPDVVFLFIDTWESGEDREKKVKNFVEKNNYSFLVLYDETKKENANEFTVVSDFKVEGIPTKFVVDKNSNIRFKSVGYHGSEDALVNEIAAMIDLANSDSSTPAQGAKKAF